MTKSTVTEKDKVGVADLVFDNGGIRTADSNPYRRIKDLTDDEKNDIINTVKNSKHPKKAATEMAEKYNLERKALNAFLRENGVKQRHSKDPAEEQEISFYKEVDRRIEESFSSELEHVESFMNRIILDSLSDTVKEVYEEIEQLRAITLENYKKAEYSKMKYSNAIIDLATLIKYEIENTDNERKNTYNIANNLLEGLLN